MTEPVIPYATPHEHHGLTARSLFGVVVRTIGLIMILWGLYTLTYLINVRAVNAPTAGQPVGSFLITAVFGLVVGLALLRGEWLVRFAYGLMVLVVCCLVPGPVDAADEVFDSNGVKIRYVTEGKGEPVVLIHGWMSDSGMWGQDQSGNTRLDTAGADGFQLIALDCRGHGKSDKPHDPEKYGPEMAADVVRLLDHLKIGKAHLIGYSSGAFIAGKVAATHPERVLSVVYAGQAPVITEAMKASDFSEVDVFAKAVDEGKGLGSYIIAVTPPDMGTPTEDFAKAIANSLYGDKDVKAFSAAGRGFKNLDVTVEQLAKCKAPILFIHGGNESDHVKNRVATVRELLGRGEVRIVEGGDHITTLIKPEFASAILEFLRRSGKPE